MKSKKIEMAVGRMVVREPFFASIILGVDILEDSSIPTFCTNGLNIRYNPDFCNSLTDEETIGVLVHEVEHIARLHPWRRQGRDNQKWNKATDYVINEELTQARFSLPKGALLDTAYNGLSEEQVYSKLPDPTDGSGGHGPQGQGPQGQGQGKGQGQGQGIG